MAEERHIPIPLNTALALGALLAATMLAIALRHPASADAVTVRYTIAQRSFELSSSQPVRYQVYCPHGFNPLGGGMTADPSVARSGTGAYPTSSERLGNQHGWHVTAVRIGTPMTFKVTLQVFCAKPFKSNFHPVERRFHIPPGGTASKVVTCPHGRRLISGGYLASTLVREVGGFATEARQVSPRAWQVSGYSPQLRRGGGITAIAYCLKAHRSLLSELSSPSMVSSGALGTTTAPSCPSNHQLAVGGFSEPPSGRLEFFDTAADPNGNWSVSAVGALGGGPFTAYAYCLQATRSVL